MKERIYGLDLIRPLCFLAIIIFHASWALWTDPLGPPSPLPTFLWQLANVYARSFAFSGFTILFLSSFLIGFQGNYKKHFWLPFFLLIGSLLFSFCTYLKEGTLSLGWDIYPLLFVGLLTGQLLLKRKKRERWMLMVSITILCLPIWQLPIWPKVPSLIQQILIGQCPEDYADWPLLPWIALIWLGLSSGQIFKQKNRENKNFSLRIYEWPLLTILAFYFWIYKDTYFHTALGDSWSCYTFRRPPVEFWAHLLFWFALIRMSFHPKVQKFLARNPLSLKISALMINRHFFLCYILHYLILFSLTGFFQKELETYTSWVFDLILLLVLPCTELTCRVLVNFQKANILQKMWGFQKDGDD